MAIETNTSLDRLTLAIDTLSEEERATIAAHLFRTADTSTRLALTAEGLKDLKPGRQEYGIFKELARIAVLPTYEAAAIRPSEGGGSVDILLKQRKGEQGKKDWWDGQWHVPGTVMLADDDYPEDYSDFSVMRNRLIKAELNDALNVTQVYPLSPVLREGGRGKEVTIRELLLADTKPDKELPDNARFFEIRNVLANPPDGGFVETHETFLKGIVDVLERVNTNYPPLLLS